MMKSATKSTVSSICFRLVAGLLLLAASSGQAQVVRPVTSAWTVEAGSVLEANTYMSPLKYSGWSAGVGYERWQAMRFNPADWVMRLEVRGALERTLSPAGNSAMWGLDLAGAWSMMWRRKNILAPGLTLGVGPMATLDAGVIYLPRNGNNPAQARASVTVDATAYATYALRLGKVPTVVRWQPSLALLGAFFCPDYGELYYEIALGNHSGLAHFAWPGPFRKFGSLLTVDFRFGATALRLGYRAGVLSTKANGIVNRTITQMATIGISGEWISLNPSKTLSHEAEIISAYY